MSNLTRYEPRSLIPDRDEWAQLKEICTIAAKSGLIPQKNPEQAIIVALKGRELGIPPMQAFAQISVIQGKPAVGAELQLALIYKKFPNAKIEYLETTDKICHLRVTRPGEGPQEWSFTIEDAARMNLTGKDNWKKQPKVMLQWRCISAMARAKFADALMGLSHTPEELGAEVDEEGEIIDLPSPAKEDKKLEPWPAATAALPAAAGELDKGSPPKSTEVHPEVIKLKDEAKALGFDEKGFKELIAHFNYQQIKEIFLEDVEAIRAEMKKRATPK